jgi:hypothetical protein
MAKNKTSIDRAAGELASLVQRHLAGQSLSQREKNIRALERVTARIGDSRAKSVAPRETALPRAAALRHE